MLQLLAIWTQPFVKFERPIACVASLHGAEAFHFWFLLFLLYLRGSVVTATLTSLDT